MIAHPDFLIAKEFVYDPNGLVCKNFQKEVESQEYGASVLEINNKKIIFRVAKITPKKIGQFVTLWKRIAGITAPFDIIDSFDFFIISVRYQERLGQFIFPKIVLYEKGILSKEGKGGKRGIRVYPPWDLTESPQAKKTQIWQLNYFFEIFLNKSSNMPKFLY